MGQYRDYALVSDVVIDGIDLNGDSAFTGSEGLISFRANATRMAVLNSRVISQDATWLGSARHVVLQIVISTTLHPHAHKMDSLEGMAFATPLVQSPS